MIRVIRISAEKSIRVSEDCAACIGYFDGMHRGHQHLIATTVEEAGRAGLVAAMITFDPDPWAVLKGIKDIPHLTSIEQRRDLAEKQGIERLYVISFTKALAGLEPQEFIRRIILPLRVRFLVAGFDFTFGRQGSGTAADLEQCPDFQTRIIPKVTCRSVKISSSFIERLISEGKIAEANKLLGHDYQISGRVIRGRGLGHTIGFPTANLRPDHRFVLPKPGVYCGTVTIAGSVYGAMINLGHNSSFNHHSELSLEINILDYDKEIYGQRIVVNWRRRLRGEKRFRSLVELKSQLEHDRQVIIRYLGKHRNV